MVGSLDEVDKKIITQLQSNGRTTLKDLAEIIGFSSMGTKKRLDKLIDNGTLKVAALINPSSLKLHPAIVMLEMESATAMDKLLKRFKDCPRVIQIFKTLGGYNLIALVIAENRDTLESISVEKCSLRSSEGIRRSEFYPISDMFFSSFLPIRENLTSNKSSITPCNVKCDPCNRFKIQKCVGCPTSKKYKGSL